MVWKSVATLENILYNLQTSGNAINYKMRPTFRNNPLQPKTENMCEVPNLTVNLTKPQLMLIMHIAATWCQSSPNALELQTVSLVEDTFHTCEISYSSLTSCFSKAVLSFIELNQALVSNSDAVFLKEWNTSSKVSLVGSSLTRSSYESS